MSSRKPTVYAVSFDSYEDSYIGAVFATEQDAIQYARKEARTYTEAFTGNIGYGISVQRLTAGEDPEDVEWSDYKVKIEGSRFVLAEPAPELE